MCLKCLISTLMSRDVCWESTRIKPVSRLLRQQRETTFSHTEIDEKPMKVEVMWTQGLRRGNSSFAPSSHRTFQWTSQSTLLYHWLNYNRTEDRVMLNSIYGEAPSTHKAATCKITWKHSRDITGPRPPRGPMDQCVCARTSRPTLLG